jgi:hypothetical protein
MTSIQRKIQHLQSGYVVICSDIQLDEIQKQLNETTKEFVRSLPNLNRMGTKDVWKCWITPKKS